MTYPNDRIDLSVKINDVEMGAFLDLDLYPITINDVINKQINTADLVLLHPTTVPTGWQEVVIKDGSEKIFAGVVSNKGASRMNGIQAAYKVHCSDYGAILDPKVTAIYQNQTDQYIIQDLFSEYLPEVDTSTFVEEIATVEDKRWNRLSLAEVLNDLCALSGADWYVDYDKKLHYFSTEQSTAPFNLSDEPDLSTSFPFGNANKEEDFSGIVNRLHVVGGYYLSESNETFYIPGTGETDIAALPFIMDAPSDAAMLEVWRNDGDDTTPSWTALTVLQGHDQKGNLTDNTKVIFYADEGKLEGYEDWPELNKAIKVRGRYYIPLLTTLESKSSYDLYGRWLEGKLVDESILSKADARLRGRKFLAENAYGKTSFTCTTRKPGLRSGMHIGVKDSVLSVDERLLINTVTVTIGGGRRPVYDLAMGIYDPDLIDYIIDIKRQQQKLADPLREDEVLDYVLLESEGAGFSESHSVSQSTGPYKWNQFKWNFGKWGSDT